MWCSVCALYLKQVKKAAEKELKYVFKYSEHLEGDFFTTLNPVSGQIVKSTNNYV